MSELAHRIGRFRTRLFAEGIPDSLTLGTTVRELKRILSGARVPDWLVERITEPLATPKILAEPDPAIEFFRCFLGSVRSRLEATRVEPIGRLGPSVPVELYWITRPRPLGLAARLRDHLGRRVKSRSLKEAGSDLVAGRLLAMPAPLAIDAIPTVLSTASSVPLTGLVLVDAPESAPTGDAAPLVLSGVAGLAVEFLADDPGGNGLHATDADALLSWMFGPAATTVTRAAEGTPVLVRLYELLGRLLREGRLPNALRQICRGDLSRDPRRLDRVRYEIRKTWAVLSEMTPEERRRPLTLPPGRRTEIAARAGTTVKFVVWLISHYAGDEDR
jgi:hypothetical protein